MKIKWNNVGTKVVGICAVLSFLVTSTVYALTRVESPLESETVNGYKYNYSSRLDLNSLTQNTNYVRAWTAIFVDGGKTVPAGYMGGQARLYTSTGDLKSSSSVLYSTSAALNLTILGERYWTEDTYYSQAKVQFYNGDGYVGFDANKSPYIVLSNSSSSVSSETNQLPYNLDLQEEYGVNKYGQTYGSALLESKIGKEPDLVSAVGTNGIQGYVKVEELFPLPTSLQVGDSINSNDVISLYDQDGKTVIGEFALEGDIVEFGK